MDNAAIMREHWDRRAQDYSRSRRWSRVDEEVLRMIKLKPGARLLEIGPGNALVASKILIENRKVKYFAIEISAQFVKIARNEVGGRGFFILGDTAFPPFKDGIFNLILSMSVIHHFPKNVIPGVIGKIFRLLKPGGRFILVEDWSAPPADRREELVRRYRSMNTLEQDGRECHPSEEEWRNFLSGAGFTIHSSFRAPRPLDLDWMSKNVTPENRSIVSELKALWGEEEPMVNMSIFDCEKAVCRG